MDAPDHSAVDPADVPTAFAKHFAVADSRRQQAAAAAAAADGRDEL